MSTKSVADELVALCKAGQFEEASAKLHADDIVSIEAAGAPGQDLTSTGRAAVEAKSRWWADNHEVLKVETEGPFINGDQFTVVFTMDVKPKATGEMIHMRETALYTVKGDKITEERFFYAM